MTNENDKRLERRVAAAAENALAERKYVTPIDVFRGLDWLPASSEQAWLQGRVPYLEAAVTANLNKISKAMRFFRRWARGRGLKPSETAYVARKRGRGSLRFSKSGNPNIERAYRTHWVSSELSERKRERLAERQSKPPDLVVISPISDWSCIACTATGDLLIMDEPGPLCMTCAEMDHLVFLGAGRCRADATCQGRERPLGGRRALQPLTQALRAPGDPGRGRRAGRCRAAVSRRRGRTRPPS